jgi:hypothetical protein
MLFDHEFDEGDGPAPSRPGATTALELEGWWLPGVTGSEGIGCLLSDAPAGAERRDAPRTRPDRSHRSIEAAGSG